MHKNRKDVSGAYLSSASPMKTGPSWPNAFFLRVNNECPYIFVPNDSFPKLHNHKMDRAAFCPAPTQVVARRKAGKLTVSREQEWLKLTL